MKSIIGSHQHSLGGSPPPKSRHAFPNGNCQRSRPRQYFPCLHFAIPLRSRVIFFRLQHWVLALSRSPVPISCVIPPHVVILCLDPTPTSLANCSPSDKIPFAMCFRRQVGSDRQSASTHPWVGTAAVNCRITSPQSLEFPPWASIFGPVSSTRGQFIFSARS